MGVGLGAEQCSWDLLAAQATEGPSGLLLGCVQAGLVCMVIGGDCSSRVQG